ncbi:MAG: hypothetical protein M3Q93_15725 [Gemmatimonadota bacterium]|nr:hypothetical protein [Gemmatimonadales bacterium]MDQ3139021.1 hypothetical protein [Gemmatimonadota bacterium]
MARWEPPAEQVVEVPKQRRWPLVLLLLAILGVAGGGLWVIRRQLRPPNRARMMMATNVRSEIIVAGDSLDVVVSWALADTAAGLPDSVRVEVGLGDGQESVATMTPSHRQADTLRVRAPAPGETATGYSCAAPVRGARLARERCTPWQFVRPSARAAGAAGGADSATPGSKRAGAPAPKVLRIVIEPDGQQVDPDVAGRCAAWQQLNPGRAVWIEVNQEAVPECMGPNGKPTVAKFCAFAVLVNGRRIKTENSSNDAYCERLFQAWVRERVA